MYITYRYYRLPNTIKKAKLSEKQVQRLSVPTAYIPGEHTNARGGVTEARLHINNSSVLTARVTCSYQDNFNKKTGRKLALLKLLEAAEILSNQDNFAFIKMEIEDELAMVDNRM